MLIQGNRIWIGGQLIRAQLSISGERIEAVLPYGSGEAEIDYGDRLVLPGLIDLHTHGACGFDTNDGEPEGLKRWMKKLPQEGVTSFLPTTVTQMPGVLKRAAANVAAVAEENPPGAEILGIHFEGPYLDMEYRGAQPPEAVVPPSVAQFQEYQEAAGGRIRYITLAPEHDPDHSLTRYCSSHGVVVSIGHSAASYEDTLIAVANGASSMTHVYNGMTGFHHRKPGLVGAALRIRDIYGEVIGDGLHSHPAALNNFFTAKGRDRGILVTDSLRVKYCPPGEGYFLGGHEIEVGSDGLARLKGSDTIAGSTLEMNRGLRILVEEAMVPFDAAVNACTINPASCLGIAAKKGRIAAGCDADIVVMDSHFSVLETWCRGKHFEM